MWLIALPPTTPGRICRRTGPGQRPSSWARRCPCARSTGTTRPAARTIGGAVAAIAPDPPPHATTARPFGRDPVGHPQRAGPVAVGWVAVNVGGEYRTVGSTPADPRWWSRWAEWARATPVRGDRGLRMPVPDLTAVEVDSGVAAGRWRSNHLPTPVRDLVPGRGGPVGGVGRRSATTRRSPYRRRCHPAQPAQVPSNAGARSWRLLRGVGADPADSAEALRSHLVEELYPCPRRAAVADVLQRSLLPESIPAVSVLGVDRGLTAGRGRPGGGDGTTPSSCATGRLVVLLGDVAVHGLTAAGRWPSCVMCCAPNVRRASPRCEALAEFEHVQRAPDAAHLRHRDRRTASTSATGHVERRPRPGI